MFRLEIGGKDITGPIQIPDTGGRQILMIQNVKLKKGPHVIRAVMDREGASGSIGDVDSFKFQRRQK